MDKDKVHNLISEEHNPFIRRAKQEERYAKAIWPIPELRETPLLCDDAVGKALATIAFTIHDAQQRELELKSRQELTKSRDEMHQEFMDEIADLKHKLKRSIGKLTEKEYERYTSFTEKHYKLHRKDKKYIGITVHLLGCGVGTSYKLECPICHETEDITDIDSW